MLSLLPTQTCGDIDLRQIPDQQRAFILLLHRTKLSLLPRGEARRIAANVAKLSGLLQ
jgi:hypothetical protein